MDDGDADYDDSEELSFEDDVMESADELLALLAGQLPPVDVQHAVPSMQAAQPVGVPMGQLVTKEQLCSPTSREPLALALRTMCGGASPVDFVQRVGGTVAATYAVLCVRFALMAGAHAGAKRRTCNVTWKRGNWLYHCKQCGEDPNCALCVDCFDESRHVGHDFAIGRASGGCCDCGDPTGTTSSRCRGAS